MSQMITLAAGEDRVDAYVADVPERVRGGIVLIHEVWGLVDHIKDVADRLAAEGYLVIAPDILSKAGVPPTTGLDLFRYASSADPETRSKVQPQLREMFTLPRNPEYSAWAVGALKSAVDWLEQQPGIEGRVGVVGFCFGGNFSFALAARDSRITAAVPYYGFRPPVEAIPGISCPVLALYGDQDTMLVEGLDELRADMAAHGVDFEARVYPDSGHAFFNDTNDFQYRADTAAAAWRDTLAFLAQHV